MTADNVTVFIPVAVISTNINRQAQVNCVGQASVKFCANVFVKVQLALNSCR